jgi:hypothetical protein
MGFDSREEARSYWIFLGFLILLFAFFSYQACQNQSLFKYSDTSSGTSSVPVSKPDVILRHEVKMVDQFIDIGNY